MIVNDFWFDMKDGRRAFFRSPKDEDIPDILGIFSCIGRRDGFSREIA